MQMVKHSMSLVYLLLLLWTLWACAVQYSYASRVCFCCQQDFFHSYIIHNSVLHFHIVLLECKSTPFHTDIKIEFRFEHPFPGTVNLLSYTEWKTEIFLWQGFDQNGGLYNELYNNMIIRVLNMTFKQFFSRFKAW